MSSMDARLATVCVYCGSSPSAELPLIEAAGRLGHLLAEAGVRLVYGGGGLGLMGACARAAREAGGEVLGIVPAFLVGREAPPPDARTVVVPSMHARKQRMFEEADAFVALPGGIGTLEEVIELLSWRRLGLHAKPLVFYDPQEFWRPLFSLFDQFSAGGLVPAAFLKCWSRVASVEDILPALRAAPAERFEVPALASLI